MQPPWIQALLAQSAAFSQLVPSVLAQAFVYGLHVPLAHTLIFAPGEGWIDGLPQFFQGTSLAGHTPADLAAVADELNGRPRKTLGWKTPAEALAEFLDSQAG